jgi:hypothetical protein
MHVSEASHVKLANSTPSQVMVNIYLLPLLLVHVPSPTWLVPMPPTPHLQTAMMTFPFCNPHVPTLPLCVSDDEVLFHALGFLIFPCSHPLPSCAPDLPHTRAAVADALQGMVNIPHAYSIWLLFLHLLHHCVPHRMFLPPRYIHTTLLHYC